MKGIAKVPADYVDAVDLNGDEERVLHVIVPEGALVQARRAAIDSRPRLYFKEYITRYLLAAQPFIAETEKGPSVDDNVHRPTDDHGPDASTDAQDPVEPISDGEKPARDRNEGPQSQTTL